MSKGKRPSNFIIQRTDSIGTGDAETDNVFQEDCFVDIGAVRILEDCNDPRRIILGRTGSGKTLTAKMLRTTSDNVIQIDPSTLSMKYISNSTIIRFVEELGIHLDNFFLFLWLHVLTVEIIKHIYKIDTYQAKEDFLRKIFSQLLASKSKKQALEYLTEWGDRFWEDTEERVKEFTTKLETQLSTELKLGGAASPVGAKFGHVHLDKAK